MHDGPPVGDLRLGNRVRDAVHTRDAGSIFQEDNVAVLEDFALCALNGQEILGGKDGEDKKSETNERVDGSHREGWESFSFSERGERREGARLEESPEPNAPMTVLCQPGASSQDPLPDPKTFALRSRRHEGREGCVIAFADINGYIRRIQVDSLEELLP